MVEAGGEPLPIDAGWAILPVAGHVVRRSRGGGTFGAGSTACPQDASVGGPGYEVDGEPEPGAGARHSMDGEVPGAESAVHGAGVWAEPTRGMISSSLIVGTSAVICRNETDRYHPWSAARKMTPHCVLLLHTSRSGGTAQRCRLHARCRGVSQPPPGEGFMVND